MFVLGIDLQKKWKSLRDGYVKELKKIKTVKSGSATPVKSSYLFFRRLQFLQPTVQKNSTESNFETDFDSYENPETENLNQETSSNTPNQAEKNSNQQQQRKKIKLPPADEHFANIIEKSLNNRNNYEKKEDDEDKLFCMSLYNEIKKVPEAMRLKTKIDIYNLILQKQTIQQTQSPSLTVLSPTNHPSTSFVQPLPRPLGYPQYTYDMQQNHGNITYQNRVPTNYTTVPYEMRQNYVHTQNNQNCDSPGTPSTSSGITENSQGSSDIDLFE